MAAADYAALAPRVQAPAPAEGERIRFPELGLEVLNLHHGRQGNPPVENHGFLLRLGGWTVLHIGDTEAGSEDLAAYRLPEEGIDVAFVPSWYLAVARWRSTFDAHLDARHVVVMHLTPGWNEGQSPQDRDRVRRIRRELPYAVVFTREGERRVFEP